MCPKPLHTKLDLRQFSQGTNYDDNTEFLGNGDSGEDLTSLNMRHDEYDKDSKTKIGGELLTYDAFNNACYLTVPTPLATDYICIGTRNFFLEDDKKDHVIEIWASPTQDSFIRIDGKVVLISPDFPVTY